METYNSTQLSDVLEGDEATPPVELHRKLVWLRKGSLALIDQGLLSGSNFLIAILWRAG
jgi:hypothetical protein